MIPLLRKTTLILLECLTVLLVMASVAAGVLMWRLQQGPIAVDFVKSILAERLAARDPSVALTFDTAHLTWPDWREPLVIDIQNLHLTQHGDTRLRLPTAAISIARLPLLAGQIKPVAAIFRQPDFRFIRTADNRFLLMSAVPGEVGKPVATDPTETTDMTGIIALFHSFAAGKPLTTSVHNAPAWPAFLAEFEAIKVEDAVIVFEDADGRIDWAMPHVNAQLARDGQGLEAQLTAHMPGEAPMVTTLSAIPASDGGLAIAARTNNFPLISPFRQALLAATGGVADFDKAALDASLNVTFTDSAHITLASGTLDIPAVRVRLHDILPAPLTLTDAKIGFDYQSVDGRGTIRITPSQLNVNDAPMTMEAALTRSATSITGPVQMQVSGLPIATLHGLWPTAIKDTQAGIWLTQKITDGRVEQADFSLTLSGQQSISTETETDEIDLTLDNPWAETGLPLGPVWQWGVDDVAADFTYSGLTLDYHAPLTILTQANGTGTYRDETLNVGITEGKLQDITVRNGNVMIDKIETKGVESNVVLTLPVSGPLAALMAYLAAEPVGLDKELLADPKGVAGTFDATTIIRFPAIYDLPRDRVKVEVTGKARDVTWPDAAISLPLRQGMLDISVAGDNLAIKGQGMFDTAPVTFDWERLVTTPAAPEVELSRLTATIQSNDDLRPKLGFPAGDSVTGIVPLAITYSENARRDGAMTIAADLTQAAVTIAPLGMRKAAGQPAQGQGKLIFTGNTLTAIRDMALTVPDGRITDGVMRLRPGKDGPDLVDLTLQRVQLHNQDFALTLTRPQADLYDIDMTATKFDARPFLKPTAPTQATQAADDPMRYDLTLKAATLQTTDSHDLRDVNLSLLTAADDSLASLSLSGTAAGTPLTARFAAPTLQIEAANAGHALRALGIYDTIMGGRLTITGTASNGQTTAKLEGEAVLENFTVVKAPALARLLNALSLTGIGGLLEDKGIDFKRLQTQFAWIDTPQAQMITLANGRTSGASLGLTFEGDLNRAARTLDLKGTIIPMSEINKFIGKIPVIGDILLGGKNGSLIAATYTLKGGYDDPQVMINPLSVLTPGFIRTILFEQDKAPPAPLTKDKSVNE